LSRPSIPSARRRPDGAPPDLVAIEHAAHPNHDLSRAQHPYADLATLRLFYSLRDFQFALSAFDFFLEVDAADSYSVVELRRFRCYLDAGVIAYGRPFTQTEGVPLLSFKKLGVKPTVRQKALHDQLLAYRHKVVAHSDANRMRIAVKSLVPFEDRPDIRLPIMRTDEGLPFLEVRSEIIEWLHFLMSTLGAKTFAIAQTGDAPFELVKDYLATP
jgi:hypothetical protein